ncbi:MAG: hypothetical protein IJU19_03790 [Bacteroidales bacterium]|nr:hypothetical protein [Bacteroidales bacterium]
MNPRLCLLLALLPLCLHAQTQPTVAQEFDFVMYLIGNGMKEEALVATHRTPLGGDSINFLKGYAHYSAQMLDTASSYFAHIAPSSPLFSEGSFYGTISESHLGHYDRALNLLHRLPEENAQERNLALFETAGIKLLQRDMQTFDSLFPLIDTSDYRLNAEVRDLLHLRTNLGSHKAKRPWVAGACSAVLPGLGKVYAGKLGEGLSAFLITGGLMATTAENYVHHGATHWMTLATGLLSAVFYVGNIYGSVATARVSLNTFNQRHDLQILYDIHIPVRAHYRR